MNVSLIVTVNVSYLYFDVTLIVPVTVTVIVISFTSSCVPFNLGLEVSFFLNKNTIFQACISQITVPSSAILDNISINEPYRFDIDMSNLNNLSAIDGMKKEF